MHWKTLSDKVPNPQKYRQVVITTASFAGKPNDHRQQNDCRQGKLFGKKPGCNQTPKHGGEGDQHPLPSKKGARGAEVPLLSCLEIKYFSQFLLPFVLPLSLLENGEFQGCRKHSKCGRHMHLGAPSRAKALCKLKGAHNIHNLRKVGDTCPLLLRPC